MIFRLYKNDNMIVESPTMNDILMFIKNIENRGLYEQIKDEEDLLNIEDLDNTYRFEVV